MRKSLIPVLVMSLVAMAVPAWQAQAQGKGKGADVVDGLVFAPIDLNIVMARRSTIGDGGNSAIHWVEAEPNVTATVNGNTIHFDDGDGGADEDNGGDGDNFIDLTASKGQNGETQSAWLMLNDLVLGNGGYSGDGVFVYDFNGSGEPGDTTDPDGMADSGDEVEDIVVLLRFEHVQINPNGGKLHGTIHNQASDSEDVAQPRVNGRVQGNRQQ